MSSPLLTRALPLALALSAAFAATPTWAQSSAPSFTSQASAEQTHELFYNVWRLGIALNYFGMGYSDEDGNFINLAGWQITSASVILRYTAEPGDDIGAIRMHMDVPVLDAQSTWFEVTGDQLTQTAPGVWSYTLTTDIFNGTVREGRFGIESFALDPDGNPIGLGGEMSADTGFYFTVQSPVPEAGTALMMLGGLGVLPLLARRRRTAAAAA